MLRVLCREDFSIQSARMFVADVKTALEWLDAHFIYTPKQARLMSRPILCCPIPCSTLLGEVALRDGARAQRPCRLLTIHRSMLRSTLGGF